MICVLREKRGLLSVVIAALLVVAMTVKAFAADTVSVDVTGTYGQTEARSMLSLVNDFRTGRITDGGQSTVWAYNAQGGIDTASYAGLSELEYDYELEKVAKERAMELVLQFEHQRPNGQSSDSLFPDGYSAHGENIAAGYGNNSNTARKAFDSWCETNRPYGGQGHRRSMLGRGYNRIGIAHIVVDYSGNLTEGDKDYYYTTRIHYWVQEFGYRDDSYGLAPTAADDSETTLPVDVLSSNIEHVGIETDADTYEMVYGDKLTFDGANSVIRLTDTWPDEFNLTWSDGASSKGTYYVTVGAGYSIGIADNSIASVSEKTITAKKAGTTDMTVTSDLDNDASKSVSLTVRPASIDDATATVSGSFTYDGTAKRPAVVVKKNGKTLTADTDYTVEYDKNTDAGTAIANVTGKGNYTGSCSTSFEIKPLQLDADMFAVNDSSLVYNGNTQAPEVSGKFGNIDLIQGTDYTFECDEAVNAGEYGLNIIGKGNCTGNVPLTFEIKKAENPPTMPENEYVVPYMTNVLDNKILEDAEGWEFDPDKIGDELIVGGNSFEAKYTGSGAGNYIHETKNVVITRNKCLHPDASVEIIKKVAPDCENDGYTGDKYCADCKTVFEYGKTDPSTGHEWSDWNITTKPTCLKEGEEARTCSKCSKTERRVVDKLNHVLSRVESKEPGCETEGNTEYYTCSMCKGYFDSDANPISPDSVIIPAAGHTWSEWSTSTEPTCSKKGEDTRTCSDCSKKETRPVEKLPHQLTRVEAVAPLCEADGNIDYYVCDSCGGFFDNETDQNELTEADVVIPASGHKWGEWETTIEPSASAAGEKERKCSACGAIETEPVPYKDTTGNEEEGAAPGSDPNQRGKDGTAIGEGASAAAAEKAIVTMRDDNDLPGAVYYKLRLRSPKQTKSSITLNWTKNSKAAAYVIYGNKCGKTTKPKRLAAVKGSTKTIKKVAGRKLQKGTYYKFIVVALDKDNNVVSTSKLIHVATKGGKAGNYKSVTVKNAVVTKSKSLKKGKSLKLNAKAVAKSKNLPVKKHVAVRYETTNKKIATVSKTGRITARKKGTCYIYAYAQNGVFRKIKVTVK